MNLCHLLWPFIFSLVLNTHAYGLDLNTLDEDKFLGPHGEARILQIYPSTGKEPLILIHGVNGSPKDLEGIARLVQNDFDLYVLAFNDHGRFASLNGDDFGKELLRFKGQDITIIAYSMGGLVARRAFNYLLPELQNMGQIKLYTIDTPWQGFSGPSDTGIGKLLMATSRPFMPKGYFELRARSNFMKSLYRPLPRNIQIHMAFAQTGPIQKFVRKNKSKAFKGSLKGGQMTINLVKAMQQSVNYQSKDFPHFSGDHSTVLQGDYLDFLLKELRL